MRQQLLASSLVVLFALALPYACSDSEEQPPPPQCSTMDCSAMGFDCGRIDDANGQCFICGTCQLPATCGGGGRANVCGCVGRTQCEANECGTVDDGCGGSLECGGCVAPIVCGAAGVPNRCAEVSGPGDPCDETLVFCGAGLECCPVVGRPNLCLEPGAGGVCPTSGVDLEIDQVELQRTVSIGTQNITGALCDLPFGCELASGERELLSFKAVVVNTGTSAADFGEFAPSNPLMTADQCTNDYKIDMLTWRLLQGQMVVASGSLRRQCFEDSEQRDPTSWRGQFNCDEREAGISGGWASTLRVGRRGCDKVDTTGLPSGDYVFELTINRDRKLPEFDFTNNVATATITIP